MTDPTKPGPDADRIAELERGIERCENMVAWHPNDWETRDKITTLRAELARLRDEQPKGGDALLAEGLPPFKPCAYIHEAANFTEILLEDCGTVTREQGVREVALLYSFDRERIVGMRMYGKPAPSPATPPEPQEGDAIDREAAVAVARQEAHREQPWPSERLINDLVAAGESEYAAPSPAPSPEPPDVRGTLEMQLSDLIELARDTQSDKGAEAEWVHPRGALIREFANRIAAIAQSGDAQPREPDDTKVICPNCTHQFTAISVADQARLRAQSDAQPVGWQADLKEAADFIADEYRDPSFEPDGEWLPPEARRIHTKLVALYTAPHSPDASGLIEAADEIARIAVGYLGYGDPTKFFRFEKLVSEIQEALRARAADRSVK